MMRDPKDIATELVQKWTTYPGNAVRLGSDGWLLSFTGDDRQGFIEAISQAIADARAARGGEG